MDSDRPEEPGTSGATEVRYHLGVAQWKLQPLMRCRPWINSHLIVTVANGSSIIVRLLANVLDSIGRVCRVMRGLRLS